MPEQVQWGVMGNANIARVCVIPAIQTSGNGRVHTLATRSPQNARPVATEHQVARMVTGYEALLDDPVIDAVYIPLPNHLHHHWAIRAFEAGKHVLCEKPLACNARQAREMVDAAAACGCLLMEGFMYRFHSRMQQIRRLIAEGAIGDPRLIRIAFCYKMSDEDMDNPHNARLKPEMGGGALLDVGCYGVSVARWLYGREPRQVQAQAHFSAGDVDLHLVGSLWFSDLGLATIEASFVTALQQTFSVVGSRGAIDLPHDAFIPWEKPTTFQLRTTEQEAGQTVATAGEDEYRRMVTHFADAILGKAPLDADPQDSVANMKVLDALARSARSGQTVSV